MATSTNGNTTNKITRIQEHEKELLSQLREIYTNNYKKYFEYIRRESNVPISVKKIYKLLDERQAYRRISDYFHRERLGRKVRSSNSNGLNKSHHPPATHSLTQVCESKSAIQTDHEMYDEYDSVYQQSNSPIIINNNEESLETKYLVQESHPSSSMNLVHSQKRRLSLINNRQRQQQSIMTSNSQSDLLLVRVSIQKALHELDRIIISKSDSITEEDDNEEQRLVIQKTNNGCHSKLDDIIRSLSNVVNQQQENARLIINESSALLIDNSKQSENISTTTQESIKYILERLNTLVDRSHSIYDRIENILSEF